MLVLGASAGCGVLDSVELPNGAPTSVERIADSGFHNAGAVASSPDGNTFYVAAYDDDRKPGVFAVNAADGSVSPLHVGAPFVYPTDLAVSCDGSSIYVGDLQLGSSADPLLGGFAQEAEMTTPIHLLSTDGGVQELDTPGVARAAGLIIDTECESLYVAGFGDDGQPGVFRVPLDGGAAETLYSGAPLVSPTGVHVDANRVAWVMDHAAAGEQGEGMLFAVDPEGNISEVASGLGMGRHGGVSLAPGGTTAVIPVSDAFNHSMLITANTENGEVSAMETPDITHPTGVAAAREAPVMVVAGESSIHIATFE